MSILIKFCQRFIACYSKLCIWIFLAIKIMFSRTFIYRNTFFAFTLLHWKFALQFFTKWPFFRHNKQRSFFKENRFSWSIYIHKNDGIFYKTHKIGRVQQITEWTHHILVDIRIMVITINIYSTTTSIHNLLYFKIMQHIS